MKHLLFAILALALFSCTCDYPESYNMEITDAQIENLRILKEVEWPKAYREQDTILLDRILANEFQFIQADGFYSNKEIEMDYIKNNEYTYDSFHFEIKRFDIFENGTAIVSGTGHILIDTTKITYESSNVLILRNGEWKAISSHVSGVK
ncbi:MAG: hypothetical protein C0597_07940 [Marinilabiliales bacterium]|nr:MAG: hypothetical protein C0597_07940 [Marinilabiliales bacterium]